MRKLHLPSPGLLTISEDEITYTIPRANRTPEARAFCLNAPAARVLAYWHGAAAEQFRKEPIGFPKMVQAALSECLGHPHWGWFESTHPLAKPLVSAPLNWTELLWDIDVSEGVDEFGRPTDPENIPTLLLALNAYENAVFYADRLCRAAKAFRFLSYQLKRQSLLAGEGREESSEDVIRRGRLPDNSLPEKYRFVIEVCDKVKSFFGTLNLSAAPTKSLFKFREWILLKTHKQHDVKTHLGYRRFELAAPMLMECCRQPEAVAESSMRVTFHRAKSAENNS